MPISLKGNRPGDEESNEQRQRGRGRLSQEGEGGQGASQAEGRDRRARLPAGGDSPGQGLRWECAECAPGTEGAQARGWERGRTQLPQALVALCRSVGFILSAMGNRRGRREPEIYMWRKLL